MNKRITGGSDESHMSWETIDPTPDIHALFDAFDTQFFEGKLKHVELEWSNRMNNHAGICYHSESLFYNRIVIRLNDPLLKTRSRLNLVETLLVLKLTFCLSICCIFCLTF